jgi:arginase family enzyme
MRDWRSGLSLDFEGPLYISLDLDALDPAFAPGVSHHEPGGLSVRDVLGIIQNVSGTVVGADIVEYNPTRDINSVTAMVAAKFCKELLARIIGDA